MGYPSIDEIAQQVKEWSFVNNLPEEFNGFKKEMKVEKRGQLLFICSYVNEALRARLDIIYTSETFDYILCRTMGLNEYRDIRFIYKQRDVFEREVESHIESVLAEMSSPEHRKHVYIVDEKGIPNWEYGNNLPQKIGRFELYIRPCETIRHINGSFIFLDYSDFDRKDQLVIMYNVLRDEIFAELKVAGVFRTSRVFDSGNLQELEEKLKNHLHETLDFITATDHEI